MKKVLLVTLQSDNIGGRLQNYALQQTLIQMGCEVWTPFYYIPELNTFKKRTKNFVKVLLGNIGISKYQPQAYRCKRLSKYEQFNRKYITNRIKICYSASFKRSWKEFDFAVTGSDQVWHRWSDGEKELEYYYLEFIEKDKRIAYAPSFGFDRFPEQDVEIHAKGIQGMRCISCREEKGHELIKSLTGREAEVVLDPTFLLDKKQWSQMGKRPNRFWKESGISKNREPFILVYFLGEITRIFKNVIKQFAEENDLKVIDIFDISSLDSQLTTPDEFIWLVEHASYVCTDSFHAAAFSIMFEKNFLVFKRCQLGMDKMFDRIENLLKMFDLEERVYKGDIKDIYMNYTVREKEILKVKSLNFLNKCLERGGVKVISMLFCHLLYGKILKLYLKKIWW